MQGVVKLVLPDQWTSAVEAQDYVLEPGEEKAMAFEVTSPVEASDATAQIQAVVSYSGNEGDKKAVSIGLQFVNPPALYYDHVDAGESVSEREHNLKASPTSGTNSEAGLTRRYVQKGVANGYFEYEMKVEAGKPFMIRAIETYDRDQIKDYYVMVNGVKVLSRIHETKQGGIVTYQFIVDDVSLSKDGLVTVRFQEDEEGRQYDPSIADVWTMPL
jgi:alpha-L-rhamnosidase